MALARTKVSTTAANRYAVQRTFEKRPLIATGKTGTAAAGHRGLTDFAPGEGRFLLDHDQRHTLRIGGNLTVVCGWQVAAMLYAGSGVPDDDTGTYLPTHCQFDFGVTRPITPKVALALNVLNATNRQPLIDNSLTFRRHALPAAARALRRTWIQLSLLSLEPATSGRPVSAMYARHHRRGFRTGRGWHDAHVRCDCSCGGGHRDHRSSCRTAHATAAGGAPR